MRDIIASVRSFWPFYLSAWLFFPVLVLAVRFLGISLPGWWLLVCSFSLAAGLIPWVPWLRGNVSYSVNAFWAILVPFISLLLAVTVASVAA
ncbi:hypothetical protein ASE35_05725 [Lysobacter sp. Root916]|nr:hypothetical protein ASE35_05725 [Lysobacter sp. Root916]